MEDFSTCLKPRRSPRAIDVSFRTSRNAVNMSAKPISRPGTIPPRKSLPTETPIMAPMITMGMLGGMTIPIVEEMAVTATEYGRGYLSSIMWGMRILPMPAVSATAEPEIPAKIMLARMFTWARPPVRCPTRASQNSMILRLIPPQPIRFAASM